MHLSNNQTAAKTKKGALQLIVGIVGTLLVLTGIWISKQPFYTGEPFIVTVDGFSITPGQTTVQELLDAGFLVGEREFDPSTMKNAFAEYDPAAEVEKQSYLIGGDLYKGDTQACGVEITNTSSKSVALSECVITYVMISPEQAAALPILVGETPAADFTLENITNYYPDAEVRSSTTVVDNKNYQLTFTKENGKLTFIRSSYNKYNQ